MYPLPVHSPPPYLRPLPLPSEMQADRGNYVIRLLVLSSGVVSTLAGQAGSAGSTDGVATNARFNDPRGIALDAAGTFAVVVRRGERGAIRKGIRRVGWRRMKDRDRDAPSPLLSSPPLASPTLNSTPLSWLKHLSLPFHIVRRLIIAIILSESFFSLDRLCHRLGRQLRP